MMDVYLLHIYPQMMKNKSIKLLLSCLPYTCSMFHKSWNDLTSYFPVFLIWFNQLIRILCSLKRNCLTDWLHSFNQVTSTQRKLLRTPSPAVTMKPAAWITIRNDMEQLIKEFLTLQESTDMNFQLCLLCKKFFLLGFIAS